MKGKRGFTLAELLIVVAIIAILVAISIPLFSSQLEKSRKATDMANARNLKAVMASALVDGTIELGDGAKVMIEIFKNSGPVLVFKGSVKVNGVQIGSTTSNAKGQYTLNTQGGGVGDMIKLLSQSNGDVRKLRVQAKKFITNSKTEANINCYAVRLTSDGKCNYGKGAGGGLDIDGNWIDEEF